MVLPGQFINTNEQSCVIGFRARGPGPQARFAAQETVWRPAEIVYIVGTRGIGCQPSLRSSP